MRNRFIPTVVFIVYAAILIKVMVFKDLPTIHIGNIMLNFGGTESGHAANFVPFKTIMPYLLGYKGWIIAGINLIGNIILLVPLGFMLPFLFRNMTWKQSLALAIVASLSIETMQSVLHVGIFDIDDVILNVFGVMIGYWKYLIIARWIRERKYKTIAVATILGIAILIALYAKVIYPMTHQQVNPEANVVGGDLCGGTGGTGEIISKGENVITIKRNDGVQQTIKLAARTDIRNSAGPIPATDLKIGDHVTLVIPGADQIASTVLECK